MISGRFISLSDLVSQCTFYDMTRRIMMTFPFCMIIWAMNSCTVECEKFTRARPCLVDHLKESKQDKEQETVSFAVIFPFNLR